MNEIAPVDPIQEHVTQVAFYLIYALGVLLNLSGWTWMNSANSNVMLIFFTLENILRKRKGKFPYSPCVAVYHTALYG
jgi:hypothetical protein